jgi:hypothetical protein
MPNITFETLEAFVAPIEINWTYDGKYILDGTMYLGGGRTHRPRLPLVEAFYMLTHEIAHLLEIDDSRALDPFGWGLQHGTYFETGSRVGFHTYQTDAHLQRELRVYAIQSKFHEYFDMAFDIKRAVHVLRDYVDGFGNLSGGSDEERVTIAVAKIESLRQQPEYSFPVLMAEFERKKELVKESCKNYH